MMKLDATIIPETPGGKPAALALVADPPTPMLMAVIAVFSQTVWLSVPGAEFKVSVGNGSTVIRPLSVIAGHALPVVEMV